MGELVGLGLRGVGKSAINIDLVPSVVEELRAADKRKPFLIGAAAVLLGGFALWAVFQNLAAAKAKDEVRTIDDRRTVLQPLKSDIDQLVRKEDSLRKIATAYTDAEFAHTYWMDVIAEVRGAFASDIVWLTDFEPLVGYDPLAAPVAGAKPGAKAELGKSFIKNDFATVAYGTSAMVELKPAADVTVPARRGAADAASPVVTANAVRIRGFWRNKSASPNVVSDLLKNLRDNSTTFSFLIKDAKGNETNLTDSQILNITSVASGDELGLPFDITLPLKREVAVK